MNFFFRPLIAPTSYPTYPTVIDQPQSTTNSASASVVATGSEVKVIRKTDFCYKYGHKLHNFEGKAPYPLSYDQPILELEALDNKLCKYLRNSISFVDFQEPPKRVLDLGCGTGTWVIDAAKEWPECELVGFDLVDVQIPLKVLDPSIAHRIEWKHGNFLTTRLPFEDDEFDHVHIHAIARAVPEHKWGVLFEEICRVLCTEGTIEVIEDDIIFPILPRWFTSALRARTFLERTYSHKSEHKSNIEPTIPPHDHGLLESLHSVVYSTRFINVKPSSILPSYMTTYFRNVELGHTTSFPMPPVAPLRPLPEQSTSPLIVPTTQDTADYNVSTTDQGTLDTLRTSISFPPSSCSSTIVVESDLSRPRSSTSTESSVDDHSRSATPHLLKDTSATDLATLPLSRRFFVDEDEISTAGYQPLPTTSLHRQKITSLSERSLAMQLHRSYQSVLACKEAMWEELKDRIRNKKDELIAFGWEDDEELEELQSRKKFEKLIERYESDMQTRLSLWCSLTDLGWQVPFRDTLTKAELVQEESLRQSLAEGCKEATWDDLLKTCRTVRVIIGHNP